MPAPDGSFAKFLEELKDAAGAAVATLSAIGALLFGAQRIAYERFYDEFGITPEDVGIDVARVLAQTAAGVCLFLVLVTLYVGVVLLFLSGGRVARRGLAARHTGRVIRTGLVAAVVATALLVWGNWADADDAAKCAARADGQSVRALRFAGITRLGIRADRAVARTTDEQHPPTWNGRRVVYLGTGEGAAVLYDPTDRSTLRVPTGELTLAIETTGERFRPREGCRPGQS